MAVARVNLSSGQFGAVTSLTISGVTQPAAGNLLVVVLALDKADGGVTNTAGGLTEFVDQSGASVSIWAGRKIATGSGETSFSFTIGSAPPSGGSWFAVEYSGVDRTTPLNLAALDLPAYNDTNRTSITLNPGAATSDGLALAFFAGDSLTGAPTTTQFQPAATGWPWVTTKAVTVDGPAVVAYAERAVTSGTDLPATTFTWTQSDQAAGFAVLVNSATVGSAVTASLSATGTLSASVVTVTTVNASLTAAGTLTAEVATPSTPAGPVGHEQALHQWSMFSRNPDYTLGVALPILSAQAVVRHLGVGAAVVTTPFTPQVWAALQPSCGVELWRDGRQEFTGRLVAREATWDRESSKAVLKLEVKGDELVFADRLVMPDPARAADDQVVSDYWTLTARASTAMRQLISDQAGPTAEASRRVPGMVLGDDPNVGPTRTWSTLFLPVLDQLAAISVASGANLGIRMTTDNGILRAQVTTSSDLAATVRFSADLSNLVGWTYRDEAPTVTHALAAGSGDLRLRLRKLAVTGDPLATQWGRQIWSYVDRRDSDVPAELLTAAQDALAEGGPTVSLAVQLTDSQAATYGVDWGLGDRITVHVGLPGQTRIASVSDVVREISFDVAADGTEKITPAIGSYDAKAVIPTPTQRQLADIGSALAGLIARK